MAKQFGIVENNNMPSICPLVVDCDLGHTTLSIYPL